MKGCVRACCITKYFRVASPIDDAVNDYVSDHSDTTEESHIEPPAPSPQADGPIAQPIDEDSVLNDLGLVIKESMTDSEVSTSVAGVNAGQKYTLLTNHYRPGRNFMFPKTFSDGCCRSFQLRWLDKYPWLVYSKELDGGFCKFCSLFARNRSALGVLVNKPFRRWVKVTKIVDGHASHKYHTDAVEAALRGTTLCAAVMETIVGIN